MWPPEGPARKNNSMRLIGIDYGTKRIGLSFADTTLGVVLPYGLIEAVKPEAQVAEAVALIESDQVSTVVVGYPAEAAGRTQKTAEKIQAFVFELQKRLTIPVVMTDERYTSAAADGRFPGVSRDEAAAVLILEGYLERQKRK